MARIGSAQDLAQEFGGTFVPDNSRNGGAVLASYFGCEEAREDDERVFDGDPLRRRGTAILKVRSSREERICEKMGFSRGVPLDSGMPINTDDPRLRHIPVAGPRFYPPETEKPLNGQSFAFFARSARF